MSDISQASGHFLFVFLDLSPLRVESEIYNGPAMHCWPLSVADLAVLSASSFLAKSTCPATQWMFVVTSLLLSTATSFSIIISSCCLAHFDGKCEDPVMLSWCWQSCSQRCASTVVSHESCGQPKGTQLAIITHAVPWYTQVRNYWFRD